VCTRVKPRHSQLNFRARGRESNARSSLATVPHTPRTDSLGQAFVTFMWVKEPVQQLGAITYDRPPVDAGPVTSRDAIPGNADAFAAAKNRDAAAVV